MRGVKVAAWYGIVVGASMLVQWAIFIATGNVPELDTEPLRIAFHLAGELLTAAALLVAGLGLLRRRRWAEPLYFVAVGMVLYSEIVSPGYFAQRGQWGFVAMFAFLLVGAVVSIGLLARRQS